MKKNKYRQSVVLHKLKTGMIKPYFRLILLVYLRITSQSPCCTRLGDCRDNRWCPQSVFLIVFAWILSYRTIGHILKCINSAFAGSYSYGIGYIIDKNFAVAICAGIDFINYKITISSKISSLTIVSTLLWEADCHQNQFHYIHVCDLFVFHIP